MFAACVVDQADVSAGSAPFCRLLALDPGGVGWAAWGRWALSLGDLQGAARLLRRAVVATPDRAQTRNDYANALQALKSPETAAQTASALCSAPDNPDYLYNMGCVRQDADQLDAALRLFAWARRASPTHAESRARTGACILLRTGGYEAAPWFTTALALDPALPAALTGLGLALGRTMQGREKARTWHDRAVKVAPTFAEAVLNRGLESLYKGDLCAGWADYESRFASRGYVALSTAAPRLRDEALTGKKLYVWREQGVGDEILFSSCLPDLAEKASAGGEVTVACDRRLIGLFSRSFPTLKFIADNASIPPGYDYETPMGSLPGLYRRRLSDFPAGDAGRLRPDPATTARLRRELDALPPGLNVGLAWTSGLVTSDRRQAYTTLADWAALLRTPGVNIVNLQYGDCAQEIADAERRFGAVIHCLPDLDLKDDLDGVAALTAALDLVVCPATAVGELAAAVGTPVWRAAWRDWTLLGAETRPWSAAQRVFSPRAGETMRDVPARIAAALLSVAPSRRTETSPAPTGGFDDALRLYQAGDVDGAAALCAALSRRPPVAPRLRHLAAVIANRQDRPQEAVALLTPLVGGKDETPAIIGALALAFKKLAATAAAQDRPAAAFALYRRALALIPDDRAALINGGAAALALRRAADAQTWLRRALALEAADAAALCNFARAYELLGDEAAAEAVYAQAAALEPSNAVAHYNMSLLLLKRGDLRRGWAEHDWRFATPQFAGQGRRFSVPLWRGENIAGKRLLIWREQGVGDEIMFASCYGDAMERARTVYIRCDRRLTSLFARSFPAARFSPDDAADLDCDVHIPAGSLPRRLRPTTKSFLTAAESRLRPDPARVAFWRERLNRLGPGLKVGLAWRSGLITTERATAYLDLADWEPVFDIPGVRLVNLQYGDTAAEIDAARRRFGADIAVWNDLDLKNDFENTAALTACLDLVLCPATAVGELAGALGVPVWRLGTEDWTRLGCPARPWFPSMRVWSPKAGMRLRDVPRDIARFLRRLRDEGGGADHKARVAEQVDAGRAAFAAGRPDQAETAFRSALSVDLLCDAAWTGLGAAAAEQGDPARAVRMLMRALALHPTDAAALTTLGNARMGLRFPGHAATLHRRATRVAPQLAPAWDNLGVALSAAGDDGGAEAAHRRALRLDAGVSGPWSNLAAALRRQGRFSESAAALRRGVALDPADESVFANLTRLARQTEKAPLDNPWMDRGRRAVPESHAVAFNHGAALLAVGRLAEGWEGYERRYLAPELAGAAPDLPMPPWRGESLAGRRLLVWGEQGVGDQILFAGMLPDVIAAAEREGASVVLAPEPRLAPLFRRSFPAATVESDIAAAAQGADFHCGSASLGPYFRRRLSDFPAAPGYLRPSAALCALWRDRVAALPPGLRVGLAWRSGLLTGERRLEYTDLGAWDGLWSLPGVQVINLLYGAATETADAARRGRRLHGWDDLDLKDDFESVAALTVNLDLVISPASSVGELAAAAGAPTWRFSGAGDWTRLGTAVRPWLPAQRIFSPRPGEGFPEVAARMIGCLRAAG